MTTNRFREFLERLAEKTEEGLVNWQNTADQDSFRAWIADGIIRVSSDTLEVWTEGEAIDAPRVVVVLLNQKDEVVDELEAMQGQEPYPLLDRLFRSARRQARSADHLLDGMISALG